VDKAHAWWDYVDAGMNEDQHTHAANGCDGMIDTENIDE
jgi:hypothetical protein